MCMFDNCSIIMGVARIFQRGGHTESYRGYSSDCHLNIVGCFLIKRLSKGGSHAPQDPPGYALGHSHFPSVSPSIVPRLAQNKILSNMHHKTFRCCGLCSSHCQSSFFGTTCHGRHTSLLISSRRSPEVC